MTYATHKAGGALFALTGFAILSKTTLISPEIEPLLALTLMYPASSFGSTFPDLDHGWNSIKEHTPVSWVVHKIISITKPRHRSWQTHSLSISLVGIALMYLMLWLWNTNQWFGTSQISLSIIFLLITGFSLGVLSHLFLDLFTRAGIWLVPGVKIRLVPDNETFSTDSKGTYETIWRVVLYVLDAILFIWILNPFGIQQMIFG